MDIGLVNQHSATQTEIDAEVEQNPVTEENGENSNVNVVQDEYEIESDDGDEVMMVATADDDDDSDAETEEAMETYTAVVESLKLLSCLYRQHSATNVGPEKEAFTRHHSVQLGIIDILLVCLNHYGYPNKLKLESTEKMVYLKFMNNTNIYLKFKIIASCDNFLSTKKIA